MLTKVIWRNRHGEIRRQSLLQCTESYARDWWRRSIQECQGLWMMSLDERRNSKLQFIAVIDPLEDAD